MKEKAFNWIKQNKKEFYILTFILLVGAFLRMYRISEYMSFLGDEGRDAIVVRRLIVDFDPILVGPGTSIGNMYLGPLYYYMMAPALALAGLNPVGPAIMIAVLGVITIFMVWYAAREWFGKEAAIISASLYAVSKTVVIYSHSSWNPNIMPFFALLAIYATWKVWSHRNFNWLIVAGVAFAFMMQSHYLALLLAPTLAIFWLLTYLKVKGRQEVKVFLRKSVISIVVFAGLMSPLVIFDARHGWRNFAAMKVFFLERQTTVSARPWNAIPKAWPVTNEIMTSLFGSERELVGLLVTSVLLLGLLYIVFKPKSAAHRAWIKPLLLNITWLGVAIVGLGLYKQQIYDHYYGIFFAVPFFLIGVVVAGLKEKSKTLYKLSVVGIMALLYLNISTTPILSEPNRQLPRGREVAEKIRLEADGKPFNLAVIAERNYEDGYQYFLEKDGLDVRDIDSQRLSETVTEQLFVVCELVEREKCDPTHSPKAQIVNFGWTDVEEEWEAGGVAIYKLVHSKQDERGKD